MAKHVTRNSRAKSGARSGARSGVRSGRWLLLLLIIVLGGAAFMYGPKLSATAEAGTAYVARVGCSCRFVAGRDIASCETDRLAGMELITLVDDMEAKSVTARFPLISSTTATYEEGFGCKLEPWEE